MIRHFGVLMLLMLCGCEPLWRAGSTPAGWQVYFSPHGGCTEAVVAALDHATNSVSVQAYSFTSARIAKAVVDAHRRNVQVSVILDKGQRSEKYSDQRESIFRYRCQCL